MNAPKTVAMIALESGMRIVVSSLLAIIAVVAYSEAPALRNAPYLFSLLLLVVFSVTTWSVHSLFWNFPRRTEFFSLSSALSRVSKGRAETETQLTELMQNIRRLESERAELIRSHRELMASFSGEAAQKMVSILADEPYPSAPIAKALLDFGFRVNETWLPHVTQERVNQLHEFMIAGPKPDLVILDISMPEKSGADLIEQLWKVSGDVPVVFVGYAAPDKQGVVNLFEKFRFSSSDEFRELFVYHMLRAFQLAPRLREAVEEEVSNEGHARVAER